MGGKLIGRSQIASNCNLGGKGERHHPHKVVLTCARLQVGRISYSQTSCHHPHKVVLTCARLQVGRISYSQTSCPGRILTRLVMFGNSIYNTMTTPRLETGPFVIWFGYYWQPSHPPSTPYQRVRFRLHLRRERSGSNQFDGVWWSSTERIGAVRFVFTLRTSSSWIDPER